MINELSASLASSDSELKGLILNCRLNRMPALSHTEGVSRIAQDVFTSVGVSGELIRPIDEDSGGPWSR